MKKGALAKRNALKMGTKLTGETIDQGIVLAFYF